MLIYTSSFVAGLVCWHRECPRVHTLLGSLAPAVPWQPCLSLGWDLDRVIYTASKITMHVDDKALIQS